MRWSFLFMVLAIVFTVGVLIRGSIYYDGLSLLAVTFVLLSFAALGLSRWVEATRRRRNRARWGQR